MNAGRRWFLILGGLLVANLIAVVILTCFAHSDGESRVLPDYSIGSPAGSVR